jgi:hypothetical protein
MLQACSLRLRRHQNLFDNWFDPIETGLRERVRGVIEEMIRGELDEALARRRYGRREKRGHLRQGGDHGSARPAGDSRRQDKRVEKLGSVGVLKPCCTTRRGRIPRSITSHRQPMPSISPRPAFALRYLLVLIVLWRFVTIGGVPADQVRRFTPIDGMDTTVGS